MSESPPGPTPPAQPCGLGPASLAIGTCLVCRSSFLLANNSHLRDSRPERKRSGPLGPGIFVTVSLIAPRPPALGRLLLVPGALFRTIVAALVLLGATPALADAAPISITLRDHQFVPAEVSVPVGVKVELQISNQQTNPAEFESTSLHREKIVTPGGAISVYVGPLDAGRYEFFDDFHPATRGFLVAK